MTKGQMILAIMDLKDNDGLTFRNFVSVHYKTGWQVATEGITTTNPILAGMAAYDMGGNCGIWLSEGVYYVDKSKRVKTKREAMEIGRAHNQISILNWRTMGIAYC